MGLSSSVFLGRVVEALTPQFVAAPPAYPFRKLMTLRPWPAPRLPRCGPTQRHTLPHPHPHTLPHTPPHSPPHPHQHIRIRMWHIPVPPRTQLAAKFLSGPRSAARCRGRAAIQSAQQPRPKAGWTGLSKSLPCHISSIHCTACPRGYSALCRYHPLAPRAMSPRHHPSTGGWPR